MDTTSPLLGTNNFPLPPLPMRSARDGAVKSEDFKALLAQEGIDAPNSVAGAQITAAQIAAKAHVNLRAQRNPDVPHAAQAAPVAATPGRFMPLREGPAAARAFVAPAGESAVTNSSAGMRTTQKFATGSARKPYLEKAVPAGARTINAAQESGLIKRTLAAKAAEAYAFGANAAPRQGVPEWFAGAMENGYAKLDALKAQQR